MFTNRVASFWPIFTTVLLIICGIHALTLLISPTLWNDEVHITDYGRLFLHPHSSWSVDWWVAQGRPVIMWSYLGDCLQELALQITAPWPVGSRLASITGAVIATLAAVAWLRARGVRPFTAGVLGLVFFLDPAFVQSYRGDRTDSWVLALCLLSCWVLASPVTRASASKRYIGLIAAGALPVVSYFIWPAAPLLYPLIAVQAAEFLLALRRLGYPSAVIRGAVATIVAAGAATLTALFVPLILFRPDVISEMRPIMATLSPPPTGAVHLRDFAVAWETSPFAFLAGLAALPIRRNRAIGLVFLLLVLYLLATRIYVMHAVYLLPYILGLLGNADTSAVRATGQRRIFALGLTGLLLWAVAISLVFRPASALAQARGRDPGLLLASAKTSIGYGPHRVYMGAIEYYYAGRVLGWHMYYPFFAIPNSQLVRLWRNVDAAIFRVSDVTPATRGLLATAGMCPKTRLLAHSSSGTSGAFPLVKGAQPYGPYVLYTRLCH